MRKLTSFIFLALLATSILAKANRITPWNWQKSDCDICGLAFKPIKGQKIGKNTALFLQTISSEKQTLVHIYNISPQEYNLLAHMAYGILGNESEFFTNWRYQVKKNAQLEISIYKAAKAFIKDQEASPNSRGATQIKQVPEKIKAVYHISEKHLWSPRNSALATMGFLIDALRELKQRAENNNLEFITKETYVDYLPYIYFGGTKKLINRTATPDKNKYVRNMKAYMKQIQLYDVWP